MIPSLAISALKYTMRPEMVIVNVYTFFSMNICTAAIVGILALKDYVHNSPPQMLQVR